ncbi:NAD(P)H-hydrate dehydratase [Psychrobacter sp. CAL346-MNA-CIBAN-0220]|uniref:NAD(P)H-hydrate dehydratase n=1 Tax=Psychrobacter sp. CAL346-MNA-CIBAN-0220 TaxID=3140457 RepID=UPI003330D132
MQTQTSPLSTGSSLPIALYSSQQVYNMERAWFAQGYSSFGLMQQAAWQMAQRVMRLYDQQQQSKTFGQGMDIRRDNSQLRASIWVGSGNNGGDGWLIAHYLQQAGWQVHVMTVGIDEIEDISVSENADSASLSDSIQAQRMALAAGCSYQRFEDNACDQNQTAQSEQEKQDSHILQNKITAKFPADVYIDALFGIGLDRAPAGIYKQAITIFNYAAKQVKALVIAVDIPSGLVASTGQVFDHVAIQADVTLCLVARKFGLHTKDGMDYAGEVFDIPLIPHVTTEVAATLLTTAYGLSTRRNNSYKGSYGHVLVIGGNRVNGSQGMGGAAILAAASAMATGAGKITVACHDAFYGALLTSLPDAMTIDLHDIDGVTRLIKEASIVAIGMGLGRDEKAQGLFTSYIQVAIAEGKPIVIDADGLYHLASLPEDNPKLVTQLREHSQNYQVCLTPHSGEAARLLNKKVTDVEADRLAAIKQCADIYGGNWVLKGAGSLVLEQVLEQEQIYVCAVGNAGMATAGMGDVLSGVTAGLLAQQDLEGGQRSLRQAVIIHGLAGDTLVNQQSCDSNKNAQLFIGQRGLQAQDMPVAIRHVMQVITN